MIQHFQPPTDNLYKFIALTGIVFTITGIVVPLGVFYNLRIRELEFAAQAATAKVEFEVWQATEIRAALERDKNFQETMRLQKFFQENAVADVSEDVKAAAKEAEDRIKAEEKALLKDVERITDRAATADKAIAAVETKAQEIEFLKWTANATLWASCLLVVTGLGLGATGFYFWYFRTQIYLDELIIAESEEKKQSKKDSRGKLQTSSQRRS